MRRSGRPQRDPPDPPPPLPPPCPARPQAGDSPAADLKAAAQVKGTLMHKQHAVGAPLHLELTAITAEQKKASVYKKQRVERMNERVVGLRHKKALAAAKEAEDKANK